MSSLTAGARLDHRFTLRERLGAGGMSQVWRAEDDVLGRPVAVKVLAAELAAEPALSEATWREARAAARLTHPHVTQVYDYGQMALPDGSVLPYLVMELVDGESLADRLTRGPLPWQEAVAVCAQVASALAAAHRIGVVHRDVKPGNVMLTRGGAKVLDFGIASLAGHDPTADGGLTVGTPAYAAPERLRPGATEPASDVYALGVLLYQALTGRLPSPISTWDEAAAAAARGAVPPPPPEAPGLPRAVRRLCLACLSADPAARPTADDAARTLGAAAGQEVPREEPATAVMPAALPAAAAGFAAGSAPVPHPPTMIDYAVPAPAPVPAGRRRPRPVLIALVAAIVVLAAALIMVTTALLSNTGTGNNAQTLPPAGGATSASSAPASSAPAPTPTATTPDAIADALDATIASAQTSGQINPDAAQSLLGKVDGLRDAHGGKKVRDRAQDVQKTINEQAGDGKLDQSVAAQLIALLRPLVGADSGNGND